MFTWTFNQFLTFILIGLSFIQVHLAKLKHQVQCEYFMLMAQTEDLCEKVNLKRALILEQTNSLSLLQIEQKEKNK